MLQIKSQMRWQEGILLLLMLVFSSCVHKIPPAPVLGVDIVELNKGDSAPFNGTEFSPYYLNEYLQWKANQ